MTDTNAEPIVPVNSVYSCPPWGERYQESARQRHGNFDGYPCAICGKDIRGEQRHGGIVTTAGTWTTDPNHPDSQGWFPVGAGCHRRFVVRSVL